ncbi:MAG: sulfurtransferase [Vicinamibacterales bacterium]|jgi:thiosulfate/3-mercaptopyruvate sulfurtransferase|nr:sulfurtransferase [Acidobacteriota bacterium]MDP7672900.1 sulfurtransferase [Vicinamibacterales bacterium]HJO38404.1 sulfurtransferase [Vicinamibacterales bacterium]
MSASNGPIVSTDRLAAHLDDPAWIVVDCRFDLADPAAGEQAYREAHIPGARYAHLDRDLSAAKNGTNGRHPLPGRPAIAATFGQLGMTRGHQIVAYDQGGGMFASRLWWMVRYAGHDRVAVLDGGWVKWQGEDRPSQAGTERATPTTFAPSWRTALLVDAATVARDVGNPDVTLLDARAAERYAGSTEPLDPVAGHIPGAVNHPCQTNLLPDGTFDEPDALRQRLGAVLGTATPDQIVSYCGSGVTACHNLLALALAGLDGGKLYAGSWSEWCSDPARPIERTPETS